MIKFTLTLEGNNANGLLVHNSRLSNPLDPAAKELKKLTGKRNKTDEDYLNLARVEFAGGLYIDDVAGPYIPDQNIHRMLLDAGKLNKLGMKVTRGLFVESPINPIGYKGPRDEQGLWDAGFYNQSSVKNGTNRVMRTRPWFREWAVQADIAIDPSILDIREVETIAANAGRFVGLGDWRPRFGRFNATISDVSE